jgi:hypothetical protein
MSAIKLRLDARTPYALQPSSIEFTLLIINLGAEPVRGAEPDAMCLETLDERGERLNYVPCGPPIGDPRMIEIQPQAFHNLIKISSRASGSMRDVGHYRVHCAWQGALSNVVRYQVIGDRRVYGATLRAVSAKVIEVMLVNGGPAAIEWPKPCIEDDLMLWSADGTRLEALPADEVTRVAPGEQAVLRFDVPDGLRGGPITGRFLREPFASDTVTLVS